ncbi:MAG: hypothetical protein ABI413_17825 [Ktedonobacteraceae bacterium]
MEPLCKQKQTSRISSFLLMQKSLPPTLRQNPQNNAKVFSSPFFAVIWGLWRNGTGKWLKAKKVLHMEVKDAEQAYTQQVKGDSDLFYSSAIGLRSQTKASTPFSKIFG